MYPQYLGLSLDQLALQVDRIVNPERHGPHGYRNSDPRERNARLAALAELMAQEKARRGA